MSRTDVSTNLGIEEAVDTDILGVHCRNSVIAHVAGTRGLAIGHRYWVRAGKARLLCHAWELSAHFELVSARNLIAVEVAELDCESRDGEMKSELTWSFFLIVE